MVKTEEINIAIIKAGKTKRELAKELGLSDMGLYKKIMGITEFKASEIVKLKNILNLDVAQMNNIFLQCG